MKHFKEVFVNQYILDEYGAYIIDKTLIQNVLHVLKHDDGYHFLVDMTAVDYFTCKEKRPERCAKSREGSLHPFLRFCKFRVQVAPLKYTKTFTNIILSKHQ